jgi:hypothetical protein
MMPKIIPLILVCLFLFATWKTKALNQNITLQDTLQEVTLCSRLQHKEEGYGKSAYNFQYGMRSDHEEWLRKAHNIAELIYGTMSINGDSDWFSVSGGGENPNRIKDLGTLQWSEVHEIPILPAVPRLATGLKVPVIGESWEKSSDERVT